MILLLRQFQGLASVLALVIAFLALEPSVCKGSDTHNVNHSWVQLCYKSTRSSALPNSGVDNVRKKRAAAF